MRHPFASYVDKLPGSDRGEVLICLWGYLYRNFIPRLVQKYRVIVPDDMGFGKSETPQDRIYTLQTHVENLERLIDELELNDITFVWQDWGGPITGSYTIRHPERVNRVALMNTLFGFGGGVGNADKTPWFEWIAKHEEAGTLEGILGERTGRFSGLIPRFTRGYAAGGWGTFVRKMRQKR